MGELRDWKSTISMAVFVLLLLAFSVFAGKSAFASVCPVVAFECLPDDSGRAPSEKLEASGALPWEVTSWEIIQSGVLGKGPVDVIDWADIGRPGWWDFGLYHLAYSPGHEDVLGVGIAMGSDDWLAWSIAVLYADHADWDYAIQLSEWRRKTGPATRLALESGCDGVCLTVTASIANSSPTLARELGRATDWSPIKMIDIYATASAHRSRRAERLRSLL